MENHISNRVLMVRPATFYFNEQTAQNNSFQIEPSKDCQKSDIHNKAILEFNALVDVLRNAGVTVEVIEEAAEPFTSDSVFPNNWISFHAEHTSAPATVLPEGKVEIVDKTAVLYPMWSENRQVERQKLFPEALKILPEGTTILDISPLEKEGRFLEGTGSLVLDRSNRIAYACLSSRTSQDSVELFCKRMGYKAMTFNGVDFTGKPCYHTNVMMSVADKYCVICLDSIVDLVERVEMEVMIKNSGKVVVSLSLEQMNEFAGNCLQLRGSQGTFLVMSSRAYEALTEEQIDMIGQFDNIIHSNVETIEKYGGGSVRCMIAEICNSSSTC
ncbi:unnamed protein product [Orchesella dallaii]|uniref:Amidinotransferase n=1 Tax=Orchesella dallaii TaxID=48710 RepID=A0ABP1PS37_9HEXA